MLGGRSWELNSKSTARGRPDIVCLSTGLYLSSAGEKHPYVTRGGIEWETVIGGLRIEDRVEGEDNSKVRICASRRYSAKPFEAQLVWLSTIIIRIFVFCRIHVVTGDVVYMHRSTLRKARVSTVDRLPSQPLAKSGPSQVLVRTEGFSLAVS